MPEVFIEAILVGSKGRVDEKLLLNTGAREVELAVRRSLAKKLGIKRSGKVKVYFGGRVLKADVGLVKATIRNPDTGEERTSLLEAAVLPNKTLDCSLLGVVGQEKLRVAPDTRIGKVIF